jgi:hypothetical protein
MEVVEKAKREGIIGFTVCSSAGFLAEEVLGESLDLSRYYCGFVHENGMCAMHGDEKIQELILVKGEPVWLDWPSENISQYLEEMGPEDIIIKSGNVLGVDGKAAALMACPDGGEFGKCLPYIYASGIELIVPMTINKSLHVDIDALSRMVGVKKITPKWSYGLTVGLMPLPGNVVTEIDAFKMLADVDALPLSSGAFGSGEGVVSFILEGNKANVKKAWELVSQIKGEPKLNNVFPECKTCISQRTGKGLLCNTRRYPKKDVSRSKIQ